MTHLRELRQLVASGSVSAELAALVWVLTGHGVPLVVAAAAAERAASVRRAFTALILADHPERDAVAGGTVIASSLETVIGRLGAGHGQAGDGHEHPESGIADEVRDLGIVLVMGSEGRLGVAHYVRPVERDAAGHLQRRPPAVLSAWNAEAGDFDQFWWALTDELATRAGMTRHGLEDEVDARQRILTADESVPGPADARH